MLKIWESKLAVIENFFLMKRTIYELIAVINAQSLNA